MKTKTHLKTFKKKLRINKQSIQNRLLTRAKFIKDADDVSYDLLKIWKEFERQAAQKTNWTKVDHKTGKILESRNNSETNEFKKQKKKSYDYTSHPISLTNSIFYSKKSKDNAVAESSNEDMHSRRFFDSRSTSNSKNAVSIFKNNSSIQKNHITLNQK